MAKNFLNELLREYNQELNHSGVSGERLASRLYELSKIGSTSEGGVTRPGYSEGEKQAKELVKTWMREAGLKVWEDGAGNVFGRLSSKDDSLPAIASGSHVDSVPNGGNFDGPLGVLAALEVVESWRETGFQPTRPYEVVIFSDEEGARFNGGFTGSMSLMGTLDIEKQLELVDYNGVPFQTVLETYGTNLDNLKKSSTHKNEIGFFIEVHIEQGKRLEKAGLPVGIVSGIAGPCWLEIAYSGKAGHAGNTPMNDRKDALAAASELILAVETFPKQVSDTSVATVGKLHVHPNGVNVIPGDVNFFIDIRDIHENTRDQLVTLIIEKAKSIAKNRDIEIVITEKTNVRPVPIQKEIQKLLEEAVISQQIEPMFLPSGAGHDSMIVGEEIPVGMLFVRSKDGISHNPKEWSSLNDCIVSVHVLKNVVESLTEKEII
jgi:allantoate deiminase